MFSARQVSILCHSAPIVRRAGSLRKALALETSSVTGSTDVIRPPDTLVPAKNVNELQGQIAQLIAAFQSSEKRDPAVNDTASGRPTRSSAGPTSRTPTPLVGRVLMAGAHDEPNAGDPQIPTGLLGGSQAPEPPTEEPQAGDE